MRNAGLEEAQAGIKIARRNINNLRYADDTMPLDTPSCPRAHAPAVVFPACPLSLPGPVQSERPQCLTMGEMTGPLEALRKT